MLIGPAIGIEKMKPVKKPAIDMVIRLSTMGPDYFVENDLKKDLNQHSILILKNL
jgi:hypothetical protein